MKKIIFITMLLLSCNSHAEWVVLSCADKDSSVVVEFDEKKNLVRYQNSDKRIFKADITEYKIQWTDTAYLVTQMIDRLTGNLTSILPNGDVLSRSVCSSQKKKF